MFNVLMKDSKNNPNGISIFCFADKKQKLT